MDELLQGLVDEDEADEGGKGLFCEPSDVAHQRAGISGNQQQTKHSRPQADASPQRQIGKVVVPDVKKREDEREYIIAEIRTAPVIMKMSGCNTYLQNLKRIFSKTSTGPVLPRMVRG